MNPQTTHRLCQEIRHFRSHLSSFMKWNVAQPHSETRIENFEWVAFWRDVLNVAERKIATGQIHRFVDDDSGSAVESQRQGQ